MKIRISFVNNTWAEGELTEPALDAKHVAKLLADKDATVLVFELTTEIVICPRRQISAIRVERDAL